MLLYNIKSLFLAINMAELEDGFMIMLLGLIGVFSVIILLYLITKLLGSISGKKKNNDE